jgi:hypothetical protein
MPAVVLAEKVWLPVLIDDQEELFKLHSKT